MSENSPHLRLSSLSEDILICVVSYLEPPDILRLGETCKRLHKLTSTRVVWVHAATTHVISRGFPFPDVDLDNLTTPDLIAHTKRGSSLAHRWLSGMFETQRAANIAAASGISVSDVRFVPGQDGLLMTMSKSIWSAVAIWEIGDGINSKKLCEWSPRGAIFTGFAINSDETSMGTIAISLQLHDEHFVEIMHICQAEDSTYSFKKLHSITTKLKPITLGGDLLALSDDTNQTVICNWKTGACATLKHTTDDPNSREFNECTQVVFAHKSILVARARCTFLFPCPALTFPPSPLPYKPIAQHSFGWVDGQCVTFCPFLTNYQPQGASRPPLSILVRGESDDPWAADVHDLELYTLDPNPSFDYHPQQNGNKFMATTTDPFTIATDSPYLFPPRLTHKVACLRGSLRCKQIALGRFGTALWVQPRDRFAAGLLADVSMYMHPSGRYRNEALVAAVFPGSLNPSSGKPMEEGKSENENVDDVLEAVGDSERDIVVVGRKIFENDVGSSWTSFAYDEVGGRVALGSSFGKVTILQL